MDKMLNLAGVLRLVGSVVLSWMLLTTPEAEVMVGPAGIGNDTRLIIHNYLKPRDSVTLVFDNLQKQIQSIQVSSYLDSPSDAVTVSAQFSQLPDGTHYVSTMAVNGTSKKLTVARQNSDYQKM